MERLSKNRFIEFIPKKYVENVWHLVEPLLQPAINRSVGEYTTDDVKKMIMEDKAFLSVMIENYNVVGFFISEVREFPQQKHLHISWLGGSNIDLWLEKIFEHMSKGAKKVGANYITCFGRNGWQKKLRKWTDKQMIQIYYKVKDL